MKTEVSPCKHLKSMLLLLIVGGTLALSSCQSGPFSPEARAQAKALNQYKALLEANLLNDETFDWDSLSSALILRVLPYNKQIDQAAQYRFYNDPNFTRERKIWVARPKSLKETQVFFFGLFTRDLKAEDLTEKKRFRPELLTPAGHLLEPLALKRYGRDNPFIRDTFPVFNPWEDVYMVAFPLDTNVSGSPLEFILQWPGGTQNLVLPTNIQNISNLN